MGPVAAAAARALARHPADSRHCERGRVTVADLDRVSGVARPRSEPRRILRARRARAERRRSRAAAEHADGPFEGGRGDREDHRRGRIPAALRSTSNRLVRRSGPEARQAEVEAVRAAALGATDRPRAEDARIARAGRTSPGRSAPRGWVAHHGALRLLSPSRRRRAAFGEDPGTAVVARSIRTGRRSRLRTDRAAARPCGGRASLPITARRPLESTTGSTSAPAPPPRHRGRRPAGASRHFSPPGPAMQVGQRGVRGELVRHRSASTHRGDLHR
jgi:hypothetical protein